jgi:hypothetical protein
MTTHPARTRVHAVALALFGMAVLATTGCSAVASAATAGPRPSPPVSSIPVVISCGMKVQIRPGSFTLACADRNAYVSGLSWSTWGPVAALASGTSTFNDCTPNCLSGHSHTFPALVVLWRPQPWPSRVGVRYFTRMTIIYTGNRSYTAGGKTYQVPQTQTDPLSQYGGA